MNTKTRWLTFKLEEEIYAIDVSAVKEVIRNTEVAVVPGSSPNILGILNLRGKIITVMDTRKKLSLDSKEIAPQNRIILIKAGEEELGLLVDYVHEVVDIDDEAIENASPAKDFSNNDYFKGVVQHNGDLIIILNIDNIVGSELDNLTNKVG